MDKTDFRRQAALNLLSNPAILIEINSWPLERLCKYTSEEKDLPITTLRQKALVFYISDIADGIMEQVY